MPGSDSGDKPHKASHLRRDQSIHEALTQAIITHRLAPNTRLPEDALARAFNVSRTVIRQVLQQLAHERLVTLVPHRGAHVAMPSPHEAEDIFRARQLIEVAALKTLNIPVSTERLALLVGIGESEQKALDEGRWQKAIQLSGAWHVALAGIGGNDTLTDIISQLVARSSLLIALYGSPHQPGCQHDHGELLGLLETGQHAVAYEWMHRHLQQVFEGLHFSAAKTPAPDFIAMFADHPSIAHNATAQD